MPGCQLTASTTTLAARDRLILRLLVAMIALTLLAGCTFEPDVSGVHDGVEYVTRKYNLPRERVLGLAALLGVDPEEIPSPHDYDPPLPFPIPYFKAEFEAFQRERGRKPTRPEVDYMVKGYVVKCQVISAYTDYLFYSTNADRVKLWRKQEAAVIMRVEYHENPIMRYNPEVAVFQSVRVRDIPVDPNNYPWGTMEYVSCVHQARNAGLLGTPTAEP